MIVVGQEEKNVLGTDWWSYWSVKTGFNYERFLEDYLTFRRKLQSENPLKKIRAKSNTRFKLDRIRCHNGIRSIETNASYPNVVRLLLENIPNLKAVIAHGNDAHGLIDAFEDQGLFAVPGTQIHKTGHFSRNVSYQEIDCICNQIKFP